MNEVKNIDAQVRKEYEPVSVRVLKVTPQGVLCQSGGGVGKSAALQSYNNF